MRVDLFDFDLPETLIADRPMEPRDSARLLTVGNSLDRHRFSDLPDLLRSGDVLVLNDTRVIPGRLSGVRNAERGTARVEVTLLKQINQDATGSTWLALSRPAKRLRQGDVLVFDGVPNGEVLERRQGGEVLVSFPLNRSDFLALLETNGRMPIPPYLGREADTQDTLDYQTVFASEPGAVASPTASLHVTEGLLSRLESKGISRVHVTLHVGAGTFRPIIVDDTDTHEMEAEWGEISAEAAKRINQRKAEGGRIVALGTTSLRLLESAANSDGAITPFTGETNLFITPGYRFKAVDVLITNFHLPRSTLFMLVCAFSGRQRMLSAYTHAKDSGYRFYSYGDACLLTRDRSCLEIVR